MYIFGFYGHYIDYVHRIKKIYSFTTYYVVLFILNHLKAATMETPAITEARLQAEIEALRAQYPDTQELYREVCVLLFFRHGITPTANKLYQLVRKGSMSAPAEALTRFWETLREKSRIRIEHPDLPEPLRDAAGEMVGTLWQRAQAAAQDALEQLREEARAKVLAAEGVAQAATARVQEIEQALGVARQELQAIQQQWTDAQADLARAQGEVTALQRQVDAGAAQRRELQDGFNAAQQRFTHELEQQRAAATATEERHAAEMKRMLLDADRERVNVTKLQKELEQGRRMFAALTELHRQQISEKQQQAEGLRQRNGELEGSVTELRGQRDQLLRDMDGLRLRLERLPAAKTVRVRPVNAGSAGIAKASRSKRAL